MNAHRGHPAAVLSAMFCLGGVSVWAQVLFMREMLVVFFGNELCVGTILASWLIGVSAGAFLARSVVRALHDPTRIRSVLGVLIACLAGMLPVQVLAVRTVRGILGVPAAEYAPFGAILGSSIAIFFPTCCIIGFCFPLACRALTGRAARPGAESAEAVGRTYVAESLGSMIGGAVLSYLLLPAMSPFRIVLLATALGACGAACALRGGGARRALIGLAACLAVAAAASGRGLGGAEAWAVEARWRAFGVLRDEQGGATPAVRLVDWDDTLYQNLALTESAGQYTLYGNGEVLFVFPDPVGDEHAVHFVMAQNPDARSILVLGGNPLGVLPELLRYAVRRIVYVELDTGIGEMLRRVAPDAYARAVGDPRVREVVEDAPRFVRRWPGVFDAVLIYAPEPSTAAANRFYTREFYRNVKRLLSPRGFVHTEIQSSERLEAETAELGASVHTTLSEVFPVVLVTAGDRNHFFAGGKGGAAWGGLTLDRETLYERSRAAGLRTSYFRPEYFLASDEIAGDKVRFVEERFRAAGAAANSSLRPMTYFYSLVLWARYSGSAVRRGLAVIRSVSVGRVGGWVLTAGLLALAGAVPAWCTRSRRGAVGGGGRQYARLMIAVVIGTTGFCGLALEVVLIFLVQGLYGYVYTRMGWIVGLFMLGLVLGAMSGRRLARGSEAAAWSGMAAIEILLFLLIAAIPALGSQAAQGGEGWWSRTGIEALIHGAVVATGWVVGAQFPLGNRLFCAAGGSVGAAAAVTDATDHLGAALGGLAVGVVLVPVFGIGASCLLLGTLKGSSLLCLVAARSGLAVRPDPRRRESGARTAHSCRR